MGPHPHGSVSSALRAGLPPVAQADPFFISLLVFVTRFPELGAHPSRGYRHHNRLRRTDLFIG